MRTGPVLAALIAATAAGQVVGQSAAKAPPQVQRELASMMKDCRDAGGKPGKSPGAYVVADVTGDRIADYIIDQGQLNCEGALPYVGSGGSQVIIYAGTSSGQAVKVFEHGVMEIKVDKGKTPATVKVVVGGPLCGQRVTKNTPRSAMKNCWRPLVWSSARKRMELGSPIEPVK
jgi:hypothetical protein